MPLHNVPLSQHPDRKTPLWSDCNTEGKMDGYKPYTTSEHFHWEKMTSVRNTWQRHHWNHLFRYLFLMFLIQITSAALLSVKSGLDLMSRYHLLRATRIFFLCMNHVGCLSWSEEKRAILHKCRNWDSSSGYVFMSTILWILHRP